MLDKVVTAIGRQVEAVAALLAEGDEGLQLLALDGGGGAAVLVDGVQHGMAQTDGGAAPTVTGKKVVGVQAAVLGVEVQVPLDAEIVNGLETQARGERREVARSSEESYAGQVQGGVEDVAAVGDERAAEIGIDEELLRNLPTGPLAGLRRAAFRRNFAVHGRARPWGCGAQVKALREGEADFVGIGGDVGGVDEEHIAGLGADAAHKAVGQFRFDDVAQFAVPAREGKVALEGRRANVDGGLDIGAVQRIVADGGCAVSCACQVGSLANGIKSVAQRDLGNHAPAAGGKGQREMRIEVDAAHVAGVELGFGAGEVVERRSQSPVQGRSEERAVEDVIAQVGQVKDSGLVAVGGAGKGLEAIHGDGGDEAMVGVGEREVAGHFRADGLGVVVVENQAVDVTGQEFDVAGDAGLGRQILASEGDHIDAALVDEFGADRTGDQIGGAHVPGKAGGAGGDGDAHLLFHASVEEGIPADDQVVEAWAFVAEVSIGSPAALGVVLRADNHVHAAVDDPVDLFADNETLDGGVAEDGDQDAALAAGIVDRMAEPGEVKEG